MVAIGIASMSVPVFGQVDANIGHIENNVVANTTGVTVDIGMGTLPTTVQAILSAPQTLDGYTYTNNSFLVNDGTGSLDVFGKFPTAAQNPAGGGGAGTYPVGYTPTAGDVVQLSGEYSPFDGIPEMENLTSITDGTAEGFGVGTVLAPVNETANFNNGNLESVAYVAGSPATQFNSNFGVVGQLLEIDNVVLTGAGLALPVNFPTHANLNFELNGLTQGMEGFFWASSYSADGAFGGTAIPTGPVDMTGFVTTFGSGATEVIQFTPISFTSVPEPASLSLLALGGASLLARRRARKA